jgi:hypothetical protein
MTHWASENRQHFYCSKQNSPPTCKKSRGSVWTEEAPHRVIRPMCSPQLNAILVVDPTFIAVDKYDRLALLEAIKSVVASRCDGNIEFERAQALRDWYTMTMREGEDIVEYGRRSVKLCERLASTGVPIAQRPLPKQQSLRFIDGLSTSISTYLDYKNYLSNSLTVTGVDIYPVTLVAAIDGMTKFHRGTKVSQPTTPSATVYTSLAAVEDKTKGKPRGGRDNKPKSAKGKPNCTTQTSEVKKTKTGSLRSNATTAANSDISKKSVEARRKIPHHLRAMHLPPSLAMLT